MKKTILITGATDGIGLETAKKLVKLGHHLLIHGRSAEKLIAVEKELKALCTDTKIESYIADLSIMSDVTALAKSVNDNHTKLDVLINNAGILKTNNTVTEDNLDIRFVVNTLAPYWLTKQLMPLLDKSSRGD